STLVKLFRFLAVSPDDRLNRIAAESALGNRPPACPRRNRFTLPTVNTNAIDMIQFHLAVQHHGCIAKVSFRNHSAVRCGPIDWVIWQCSVFPDESKSCESGNSCQDFRKLARTPTRAPILQRTCTQQGLVVMADCRLLDISCGC